jgi:predicted patatin/cPLA2 family phospholipase
VTGERVSLSRPSTIELLHARKRAGSKPGKRSDDRFLALVIEGGGMRGVISAGMLGALEQLGLRDSFDAVYGSSAGAIGGAYFIAGQAQFGISIYEHIGNRKFINLWRLALGKPIVSLEFLLDEICVVQKPLMFERVLASDIPLHVLAASLERKSAVVLKDFASRHELVEALRASARIPFFAGAPVHFRNDRFLDATLYESIPFQHAIEDKATDLVILLSRPLGYLRHAPSWINRRLVVPFLKRIDPAFPPLYRDRAGRYRAEIEAIQSHAEGKTLPEMVVIHPPARSRHVGAFEISQRKLALGAKDGSSAVHAIFANNRIDS